MAKNTINHKMLSVACTVFFSLNAQHVFAEKSKGTLGTAKDNVQRLFTPKSSDDFKKVQLNQLSNFEYDPSQIPTLPIVSKDSKGISPNGQMITSKRLSLYEAVKLAVSRHPTISESVSSLGAQNANIDVAKAGYYPQMSANITTGDMTSGERGRQLINLNVNQLLYDFGKVKSAVNTEQAKLLASQAGVLVSIDDIAFQVASTIVNIKKFEEITRIAREQVNGISRIAEIANLRANAGISSQADPIQAQSYLESAQSNLIVQETQLKVYKQRLKTLLGVDVNGIQWEIPESLIKKSDIYSTPKFSQIPRMMQAKAQAEVAGFEKKQAELSRYPTISVRGTVSQAVNGKNPNNDKDDGTDSSIMLEATSNFYQGGAVGSRTRSAAYAEEAAKQRLNSVYLEALDQIQTTQEQIENKQKQMKVLVAQQATSVRTKELYEEQYKLGKRTAVDLLNAEQAIHLSNTQIETARYDIYDSLVQYISTTGKSRDVYQLNNLTIQGVEIQP